MRFPLCKPPHQFGWFDTKLIFILKFHREIDGLKIVYQDVFADEFELRKMVPIDNIQKPTREQIIDAKPQYFPGSPYFHKKEKRRKRLVLSSAGRDLIRDYNEFLKKLETDGYELENLIFDPEKHQRKSKNAHTQTNSNDESSNVQCNNEEEKAAYEEILKITKIKIENIKRENEKKHEPKCSLCRIEEKLINEKRIHRGKTIKAAPDALYFSTEYEWFSCRLCYETFQIIDEEMGMSIAKTFVPIEDLRKVYKS